MADAQSILTPVKMPDSVKANAWDAYQNASGADDLAARLKTLQIPNAVKADLWDAKHAEESAHVAAKTPQPEKPVAAQPEKQGFFSSLWDQTAKPVGAMIGQTANMIGEGLRGNYSPAADMAHGVVDGSVGQLKQSGAGFQDAADSSLPASARLAGAYSGLVHGAAGLVPVIGPAAVESGSKAGQQFMEGNVAGGAGTLVGAVGMQLAPKVIEAAPGAAKAFGEAVPVARTAAADALRTSAEKNISTAINPTTRINKMLVQNKIAPGLVDRGTVASSLKDLQDQAQAHMETHGQAIDDIFDKHADAGTAISPKPILAALDAEKQSYIVDGEKINPAYVDKLQSMQDQIQKVSEANNGAIPLASLRRIKQIHDEVVSQSKSGFALPPDAQSAVNASKLYANSIRSTFADSVPELAEPSKQFNFWADTDKVVDASLLRKTGQRAPLTQKFGEMGGTYVGAHFGPVGAVAGGRIGGALGKLQNSTIWNTLSASVKSRIADLVDAGDDAGAVALANQSVVPNASGAIAAAPASAPQSKGLNVSPSNPVQQGVSVPATNGTGAQTSGPTGGGGSATRVVVAGQPRGYNAVYKLQELDDLNASHNGLTFGKNAEYGLTNDRDYANGANQGKVVNWASRSQFDPSFHITDNPDATNGPMVTDSQKNVIGGNGRAMILQRVYNGNPRGAAAYREMLKAKAGQFGVDASAVDGMKKPVLSREIPDSEFTTPDAKQTAVTDFNVKPTAELTPGERAIADSRRVSPATLDDIAGRLDAKGPDATISQMLEGKQGGEVLDKLIADGVVSPQERAAFADSNGLTPAGRERISKLMVGRFFRDPNQLDTIAPALRNKVERIAAPLAQVETKPDWNLSPHVQDALEMLEQAQKLKIGNVDDFIKQDGLFGKQKYSPRSVAMARAMQGMSSKELTAAVRQYAQDAGYASKGDALFGATPTPGASFSEAFGAKAAAAPPVAAAKTLADTADGVKLITAPAKNGKVVLAVKPGAAGYRQFGKGDAYADVHNLQPDKIDSRVGSDAWRKLLADQGHEPSDVVGFTHFANSADGKTVTPAMTYVTPDLRRQGIATSMYDAGRAAFAQEGRALGAGSQRPAGAAFRKAYDARGKASTPAGKTLADIVRSGT